MQNRFMERPTQDSWPIWPNETPGDLVVVTLIARELLERFVIKYDERFLFKSVKA